MPIPKNVVNKDHVLKALAAIDQNGVPWHRQSTKFDLLYQLRGKVDDAAARRAIELSDEKYCSVSAMLKKTATLTWRYEILPPQD